MIEALLLILALASMPAATLGICLLLEEVKQTPEMLLERQRKALEDTFALPAYEKDSSSIKE